MTTVTELREYCREHHLPIYGKKHIIEERIAKHKAEKMAAENEELAKQDVPVEKSELRSFTFTGDPRVVKDINGVRMDMNDPNSIKMHGYIFPLKAYAVEVTEDVANKLANHSHFTES